MTERKAEHAHVCFRLRRETVASTRSPIHTSFRCPRPPPRWRSPKSLPWDLHCALLLLTDNASLCCHSHVLRCVAHAQAPEEPGCNVTYTKTVTTITMEPSGNVSHVQTYNWFMPCADAPSLPPVGAPDPAVVTRTTSLIGRPQGMHTGWCPSLSAVANAHTLNMPCLRQALWECPYKHRSAHQGLALWNVSPLELPVSREHASRDSGVPGISDRILM